MLSGVDSVRETVVDSVEVGRGGWKVEGIGVGQRGGGTGWREG